MSRDISRRRRLEPHGKPATAARTAPRQRAGGTEHLARGRVGGSGVPAVGGVVFRDGRRVTADLVAAKVEPRVRVAAAALAHVLLDEATGGVAAGLSVPCMQRPGALSNGYARWVASGVVVPPHDGT